MQLTLRSLYDKLSQNMGPSGWWPADSKTEIICGAILIQNTNWRNADRAVANLRQHTHFDPHQINQLPKDELQSLVRPAGFFHNKVRALQAIFKWLASYEFDYARVAKSFGSNLRQELLKLPGIGQETADVLRVYVFDQAAFVSDKYARTLFAHLGAGNFKDYQALAQQCQLNGQFTVADAQDFHGLIDEFGKQYLRGHDHFNESFLANDQLLLK
jgi:endonuclease-3 related protein